jgi:hypothetical protein
VSPRGVVRFTSRSNRHPIAAALFAVAVLATLALSAVELVRRAPDVRAGKAAIDLADDEPHYTGSIVVPAAGTGFCRHLLFDNVTGEIREVDRGACLELAPSTNTTEGRIGTIRRYFSKGE